MQFFSKITAPRYTLGAPQQFDLGKDALKELEAVNRKFSDGTYKFEPRACAACEGINFEILATHDRYGMPVQTSLCTSCGLIQTNPDMREVDYTDFYINHYRHLYIADLVGEPASFFKEEYWRGQAIVEYVTKHGDLKPGALVVEVGCGAGGILHAFKTAGFRVIGTDLGEYNLAYGRSRGLDLRFGNLFELRLTEAPSLIIYSHVLEHIREPGRTLQQVRELLSVDGYLYIEVPGVLDVRRNVFQGDFLKTFHLAHVYNFSLTTLTNLVTKHGYSLVAGNEEVRSLFKPGKCSITAASDYATISKYIKDTEARRHLYRFRFIIKGYIKAPILWVRVAVIESLKTIGLYEKIKKILNRS